MRWRTGSPRALTKHRQLTTSWNKAPGRATVSGNTGPRFPVEGNGRADPEDVSDDQSRPGGFRAYLYGAARFVALRFERQAGRCRERPLAGAFDLDNLEADGPSLSQAFDRAWAQGVVRRARDLQQEGAKRAGPEALRRFDLLRIRFQEGLPIRDIARLWDTDAAQLHKEYARARREFKEALVEVVSFHHPGETAAVVERECVRLLDLVRQ